MKVIKKELTFEWDKGNIDKNWNKHKVKNEECEEAFYDDGNIVVNDVLYSKVETRYELLGQTKSNRKLYITFTIRGSKLRVISARDQNKKEKLKYAKQKIQKIPTFRNEDEERDFWSIHDSTDYVDWDKAEHFVFANLKPTTKPISIRLPDHMIDRLKVKANEIDIPYQSLIKQFINQGLQTA